MRVVRAWPYLAQGALTAWELFRSGCRDAVSVLLTDKPAGVPLRAE